MTKNETRWVCRRCGSTDVEATLPAWFNVNERDRMRVLSIDEEADWGWAMCMTCEHDGTRLEEIAEEKPRSETVEAMLFAALPKAGDLPPEIARAHGLSGPVWGVKFRGEVVEQGVAFAEADDLVSALNEAWKRETSEEARDRAATIRCEAAGL